MPNIFLKRDDSCVPKGWKPWTFVNNYVSDDNTSEDPKCDEFDKPKNSIRLFNDAPFPKSYLPARSFCLESIISHCVFKWEFLKKPIGASYCESNSFGEKYDCYECEEYVYGIGIPPRGNGIEAPEMGYNIADIFKQHIYTHLRLEEKIEDDDCEGYTKVVRLYGTPTLQVLQNSKLKKIYVYEGTVGGLYQVRNESNELDNFLDIGLGKSISVASGSITIKGKTHEDIPLTINGISSRGLLKVTLVNPEQNIKDIQAGDYYVLGQAWCIEDPFLLSGFWFDNETVSGNYNNSGLNLYVTSHNSPYQSGSFLGAYVWSNLSCPISSSNNMDGDWKFLWFGKTNKYFNDGNRYKETSKEQDVDSCSDTYRQQIKGYLEYELRQTASQYELDEFKANNGFLRVEIETGGSNDRHNWFAPALKGQYIKVDNVIYRIINHITSHIIDIDKTSVDGKTTLQIDEDSTYTIINHNAWIMVEHYDGNPYICSKGTEEKGEWGQCDGLFKGIVSYVTAGENNTSIVTLEEEGDHCGAWIKNAPATDEFPGNPPPERERYINANNFINRYTRTHSHDYDEPLKAYNKFQDWKLVRSHSVDKSCSDMVQDFDMVSINLSQHPEYPEAFDPYTIEITIKGDASKEISVGDECFIAFDTSFKTACCERTGRYYLDFASELKDGSGSSQSDCRNEGESAPLCLDGGYISNQYLVDIAKDYRIGFCEGKFFGVNGCAEYVYDAYNNNSVFKDYGLYLHITAFQYREDEKSISSLFKNVPVENMLCYNDVNNQKIQLRVGRNGFITLPEKREIAIGDKISESISSVNGEIKLNTDYSRLNSLYLQNFSDSPCVTFNVNLSQYLGESTHGFSVLGEGKINLDADNDCTDTNWVDSNGKTISPIIVKTARVDIGTRTSVESISIGPYESVVAKYVSDNQTIRKGMGQYDMVKISDGEMFLVYNQDINKFQVVTEEGNLIQNSATDGNKWDIDSGVMVIGTFNDGSSWGVPGKESSSRPLMVLYNVRHLSSFFDRLDRTLCIFVKGVSVSDASSGEEAISREYIGFFKVPYLSLGNTSYLCDPLELNSDSNSNCCDKYVYPEFDYSKLNKREY